jgi:hypothetical protein
MNPPAAIGIIRQSSKLLQREKYRFRFNGETAAFQRETSLCNTATMHDLCPQRRPYSHGMMDRECRDTARHEKIHNSVDGKYATASAVRPQRQSPCAFR